MTYHEINSPEFKSTALLKEHKYNNALKIIPIFKCNSLNEKSFDIYIRSIEQLLQSVMEKELNISFDELFDKNIGLTLNKLYKSLPIILYPEIDNDFSSFQLIVIGNGKNTQGTGRFIPDMISKWLIPGKILNMPSHRLLSFYFEKDPSQHLFLMEFVITIPEKYDLETVKNNLLMLSKEIRLNILAVYHARNIISMRNLSNDEKSAILHENISSLISKNDVHPNTYNEMRGMISKLSKEKKLSQIKENLAFLMNRHPNTFDRNIFENIYHISLLYRGKFTMLRHSKHISRIIAFQYIFKKSLINNYPQTKINIKLLKSQLESTNNHVLGILACFNFSQEMQRFEKFNAIKAISSCISNVTFVENSFILDRRDDKIRSFYIEIEKERFSADEIKTLKTKLPKSILYNIENVIHNIFIPRNEEEIIRNIILLSKQLKYVKDIPQVILSFEKQTNKEIYFLVILVRLIKKNTPSISNLFKYSQTLLKYLPEDVKSIGLLKSKYIKESNVFKISLKKSSFFRADHSLNLHKAREEIVKELSNVIGDFRDFNGGMISKQTQSLNNIKNLFENIETTKENLLEDFFYSLKPAVMQSIIPAITITTLFNLLINTIENELNEKYVIKLKNNQKYLIIFIASNFSSFKEKIISLIQSLKIPSFDISTVSFDYEDVSSFGIIFKPYCKNKNDKFIDLINKTMEEWAESID